MIEAWTPEEPWPNECRELQIVGPPGTGKTRAVLDHYVWPIIRDAGVVLATSFTKAAARELRERTGAHFGLEPGDYRTSLTTIHSEASRRCTHLDLKFSKPSGSKKAAEEDEEEDWAGHLARLEQRRDRDYAMAWDRVRHVWPQDIGRSPRQRLARLLYGRALDETTAIVEADMHGRFDESGRLVNPDFTGLLELALSQGTMRTVDLLAVDEAQDLSPLQWALVDSWAASANRVLIVGDPDQAIFGWAGADGARLLSWVRSGKEARRLAKSWRVPRLAHAMARDVIRGVVERIDSPYTPAERDGEIVTCQPSEAWGMCGDAQESDRDVLVLARTRQGCNDAVMELLEDGIPHIAERGRRILDENGKALRIASAAVSWAGKGKASHDAAVAFVNAISAKGPILRLNGTKTAKKKDIQSALRAWDGPVGVDWCSCNGLILQDIERMVYEPDPGWWKDALLASQADAGAVMQIIEWLLWHGTSKALLEAAKRVVVTTAHGSKGREADLVVLDARTAIRFRQRRGAVSSELQSIEERIAEDKRVLYVAVTRTKGALAIVRGDGAKADWLDVHSVRVLS